MAEKTTYGVKSIKIGDIESDGTMGQVLAALGVTYEGTAKITKAEDESKEFYCEEHDDPIETILKKGGTTIEWAITDFTPATLVKVLGGTVTGVDPDFSWEAPSAAVDIEKSIEIITRKDMKLEFVRCKISASLDISLGKEELGLVRIKATVLAPTAVGVKPYKSTPPSA